MIHSSKQLRKSHKLCKYKTRVEIVVLTARDYIVWGQEYDMNDILEDIDMFDQAQCFDDYFHHK